MTEDVLYCLKPFSEMSKGWVWFEVLSAPLPIPSRLFTSRQIASKTLVVSLNVFVFVNPTSQLPTSTNSDQTVFPVCISTSRAKSWLERPSSSSSWWWSCRGGAWNSWLFKAELRYSCLTSADPGICESNLLEIWFLFTCLFTHVECLMVRSPGHAQGHLDLMASALAVH